MRNDEKGQGLLELVISLPIIAVLLISLSTAFLYFLKLYTFSLSEFELQEQVRMPMERIVRELTYAEKVEIYGNTLRIWIWNDIGRQQSVTYSLDKSKLFKDAQPLTGGNKLGDIMITKFRCVQKKPEVIFVEIEGRNRLTQHHFSLESAVRLHRKKGNNVQNKFY